MLEREVKLSADADVTLPDLDDIEAGLAVGPTEFRHLEAVYYDTADLALARLGLTLRSRTGEPGPTWTVKLPGDDDGRLLARQEVTFEGKPGVVPAAALDLVRAASRTRPIEAVAVIRTTRTQFSLVDSRGPVLTVCDDMVSAEPLGDETFVFREVEVELAGDVADDGLLDSVVDRLREAGCRSEKRPVAKVVRALGERALAEPDVVVGDVGRKAAIGELVAAAFARSVLQLIRFDPGVRLGTEPEDLHQFRVGSRRLRSDLRTFGPLLDPTWATSLRAELRWLDNSVGAVRDADVLRLRLVERVALLPADDVVAGRRLLSRLDDERDRAGAELAETLSSERYAALLDTLVEAANAPLFAAEPAGLADQAARPLLADLARKPWRRLDRAVDALTAEPTDDELHRVRILAKRCRYCAEAAELVVGDEAHLFAERIADLQTVLGDHQDAAVAEAWLREAAKATASVRLAAGQLVAIERSDRAALREQFPKAWKKATKPGLRRWMD